MTQNAAKDTGIGDEKGNVDDDCKNDSNEGPPKKKRKLNSGMSLATDQ